uniref:Putative erythrocyte membrane protein 1 n=1 Tax=Ixodes ricinus TaxID=34613 RepID=V5H7R2_IXORI
MQALRQALPWTWAFLLFLRAVSGAIEMEAGRGSPDVKRGLMEVSGETFYGQNTTRESTSSLLGMEAYCVKMTFQQTWTMEPPNTLLLFYIDASDPWESTHRANASLDIKVESSDNVTFTFTRANKTGLMGRKVRYELLSDVHQNDSYCSILVTSMGQPNCSYWVMYIGSGNTIPDWCKTTTPDVEKCKVENYTLTKPAECGVESAEEEEEDEDDSEDSEEESSEEEESEEEESEDEEDKEGGIGR